MSTDTAPLLVVAAGSARRAYEVGEIRGVPAARVAWARAAFVIKRYPDVPLIVDGSWASAPGGNIDNLGDAISARFARLKRQ